MADLPLSTLSAPNRLFRYPDAQFLLGPLENTSFYSVPSDIYHATDIVLHCNFCGNVAWCLEPEVIDAILQIRFVKCIPSPDLPRCLPLAHQKWHINVKFALNNVPTFLPLIVPTVHSYNSIDPPEYLVISDDDDDDDDDETSTYHTLLNLDFSSLHGMAYYSILLVLSFLPSFH